MALKLSVSKSSINRQELSDTAKALLKGMYSSPTHKLYGEKIKGIEFFTTNDGMDFDLGFDESDPQKASAYMIAAVKELVKYGLIEATNSQNKIFAITAYGFAYIEKLGGNKNVK